MTAHAFSQKLYVNSTIDVSDEEIENYSLDNLSSILLH